jgi:hypothetical protein
MMSKKIQVKKYGDNYFYKAFEAIPDELLSELYSSANELVDSLRKPFKEEVYPPEATYSIISSVEREDIWNVFYAEIKKHIAKYCQIALPDLKDTENISIHSSWITRVADNEIPGHTKEELHRRIKQNNTFSNMHSHKNNQIGMVYYLKNPDPKYGTIVKLEENKLFQNDGEENSLMIFNPQNYHTAVYPTIEDLKISPRITIVLDCVINKMII